MIELRYSRNIGTISEKEQDILKNCKVFVAGCGGLGGNIIFHLLRIGIGSITAIDGDVFDETNLNRQLLSSMNTLGVSKAEIAASYAKEVNPLVQFDTKHIFLTVENADALITGYDLVIDALDNIDSRRILASACDKAGIPYIYGAIRGLTSQVGIFPAGTARKRIDTIYPVDAALSDKSCLSVTPAFCASLQVTEAVKYLLHREDCLTDRLLYCDILEHEFQEIPFAE